jgi:predicted site-specific integrase-resolvase
MPQLFCEICGRDQRVMPVYQAVLLIGVSRTTMYCWMKKGWVHWLELPSGRRLICMQSLSRNPGLRAKPPELLISGSSKPGA